MSRQQRISSLLKTEISTLLIKKINDDRIGFISITDIKLSSDLAHAWVYYSQIGNEKEKERTKKGLASATKFIHAELSKMIRYMSIPKIHFRFDESLEKGIKLSKKIDEISQ